ncbi:hypothetical protein Dpep_0041 [Dethiosulfovibrio peptidovorans DSM 11002]|uniref:Uncharacterized protein n=2 Tax=Dethiosulfovibrio TaxID=47054 RepID=D2Z2B7_9BACT|nr:hypothetical protein Dpep_0041 [Dethiosulfovibrio peptidovorans DSM 11002]
MKRQKMMMENDRRKAAAEAEANRIMAAINCPVVYRLSASQELLDLKDALEMYRAEAERAKEMVERYKGSSARRRHRKAELLVATLERRVRSAERAVC